MSDDRQRSGKVNPAIFSELSTGELENIIEYSFYNDCLDYEALKELMAVYKERKGIQDADTAAAWKDFEENYMGYDETIPLPPDFAENQEQTNATKHGKAGKMF